MRAILKQARGLKGYTMRDAAERIGISPSHYFHIEHGSRTPSIYVAIKVSKVMDVPLEEIFQEPAKK